MQVETTPSILRNDSHRKMNPKYSAIYDAEAIDASESIYPVKQAKRTKAKAKDKSRSCCCTCLYVTLAIFVVFFLLLAWLGYAVYHMIAKEVQWATVETPVDLPVAPVPDSELEVFKDQAKLFFDQILNDQVPEDDLVVTSTILNGMIAHSDYLRGHMRVRMQPDEFLLETSLPADYLPGGNHRFFVSKDSLQLSHVEWEEGVDDVTATQIVATLDLGKKFPNLDGPMFVGTFLAHIMNEEEHRLGLFLTDIHVFGKEIELDPEAKKNDAMDGMYKDPNTTKILEGIEAIRFEKDSLIIQPRHAASASSVSSSSAGVASSHAVVVEQDDEVFVLEHEAVAPVTTSTSEEPTNTGNRLRRRVLN
jgi:hypothetical protein